MRRGRRGETESVSYSVLVIVGLLGRGSLRCFERPRGAVRVGAWAGRAASCERVEHVGAERRESGACTAVHWEGDGCRGAAVGVVSRIPVRGRLLVCHSTAPGSR